VTTPKIVVIHAGNVEIFLLALELRIKSEGFVEDLNNLLPLDLQR
jgi:hypothetical protein